MSSISDPNFEVRNAQMMLNPDGTPAQWSLELWEKRADTSCLEAWHFYGHYTLPPHIEQAALLDSLDRI